MASIQHTSSRQKAMHCNAVTAHIHGAHNRQQPTDQHKDVLCIAAAGHKNPCVGRNSPSEPVIPSSKCTKTFQQHGFYARTTATRAEDATTHGVSTSLQRANSKVQKINCAVTTNRRPWFLPFHPVSLVAGLQPKVQCSQSKYANHAIHIVMSCCMQL